MFLRDFLKEGSARLESLYPAPEAMNIMLMLCQERICTSRYTHIVEPGYSVAEEALGQLTADLERLSSGEPVQYVLGYSEFCGLRFKVGPGVLIPRPETEILCQEAIKACGGARDIRILDLCTGSGCIAWTMALKVPGATVVGVDLSDEALSIATSQDFSKELEESGADRDQRAGTQKQDDKRHAPYEPVQGINDVHESHYFTSNEIRIWKYNYT